MNLRQLTLEVIAREKPATVFLPTDWDELYHLWRAGFDYGVDVMRPRLEAAQHDADRYYYLLHNPEEVREQHKAMLAAFDVARSREQTAARMRVLDRLEQTDLFEYRRLMHLLLVDEPAYTAAIDDYVQATTDAYFEGTTHA